MPVKDVADESSGPDRGPLRDRNPCVEVRILHPAHSRLSHQADRRVQLDRGHLVGAQHLSGRAKGGSADSQQKTRR